MSKIDDIQKSVNKALSGFGLSIPETEKSVLKELLLLLKDLDIDSKGNIKMSSSNLNKVSKISAKLKKIVFSKEYLRDLSDFVKGYNAVISAHNSYFGLEPEAFAKKVGELSIELVMDSLTESGMSANVIEPIRKTLVQNVTSGGSYSDLVKYLKNEISPEDGKGLLSRYAGTIATDSINTFSRAYNLVMSDQAGYEWFVYRNSLIETSREFCVHMVEKRYFHKSEIPALLKGNIDGHQCKIYEATGLPYGMKEETNEHNFLMYGGGWNCGHQIIGVPTESVPKHIRDRIPSE